MSGKGTQTDSGVSTRHSFPNTWESTVENGQQAKQSEIKLLIQENSKPQHRIVYTDGSVPKDQSFSVKQGSTTIHEDSACSLYGLKLDNGGGRSHPCLPWVASRGDSQITHAIILTDSISLLQKVKNGMGIAQTGMC